MPLQLSQSQQLRLEQKIVITLQLQQAIKLLQLSHLELVETVQNEMLENPAIEEIPGTNSETLSDAELRLQQNAQDSVSDVVDQNNGSESSDVDWERVLDEYSSSSAFKTGSGATNFDDLPPIETNLTSSESLAEHLVWQLKMASCTDPERRAALAIIHSLDHRGWLDRPLDELAEQADADMDSVEGALEIVQGFDPLGCGASNLIECLLIQVRSLWPDDDNFEKILRNHLSDLEVRNYPAIAKALEIQLEDVVEYHKMIQTLEPWPGRPFADQEPQYITPDITVVKLGDDWHILQNEDGLPRLRVSPYYRNVLRDKASSKEDKDYIKERLESADFLIKSIYKRKRTIHQVVECILERQHGFFEHGSEQLRPMVLRDVADEIGVHESTVSRVTTNKYLQCPHGIFELKYFFNAGIQRLHGEDLAAEAVKQKIRKLIADENHKKPLSDQQIVKALRVENIQIARRTVAKYREAMGILPSSQRKRMF